MRIVPSALQAHLDSGATNLCLCWRLTRRDGVEHGFTDHDRSVTFDGFSYEAVSGFTATEIEQNLGLSVDNFDVLGALNAASLNADDLLARRYDGASLRMYRVNWSAPDQNLLLFKGTLGDITRNGARFQAEVRGLAHALEQPIGRIYQHMCDADIGDARCQVDLSQPQFTGTGSVLSTTGDSSISVSGLSSFSVGWFAHGKLFWSSGTHQGLSIDIRNHRLENTAVILDLWEPVLSPIGVGDGFTITAGCDKSFETCKAKFSNHLNFQGFPHIPGTDWITGYPNRGDLNDGAPLISS